MPIDRALANLRELPGFKMKSEAELRRVVLAVLEGVREPTRDMIRAGAKPYSQEGSVRAAYEAAIDAMIDHLIHEASNG